MSTRRDNWCGMNWIRQEKRLAIYIRDNFVCQHCHRDLRTIDKGNGLRIELDHIVPVSKGGTNHQSNLFTSCSQCNNSRGDKEIDVFHPLMSDRVHIFKQAEMPLPMELAKQVIAERKAAKCQ